MSVITNYDTNLIKGSRILFVDDDLSFTTPLQQHLESQGYVVDLAQDAEEALKMAEAKAPNLFLMDVMMPGEGGWWLLKKLRSNKDFSLLPIIVLSALDSTEDQRKGYGLGADDYIKKPFPALELEKRIVRSLVDANKLKARIKRKSKNHENDNILLSGRLNEFGVITLISSAQLQRLSCVLVAKNKQGQTGRVYFKKGQISHAKIETKPPVLNEEAIYSMVSWNEGEFQFERISEDKIPSEIQATTDAILLESFTRGDAGLLGAPKGEPSEAHIPLKGSLEDFGIVALITICQTEQISGTLVVSNHKEETGLIYFKHGQASYAKIVKKPLLKNEEAIYHMLYWSEGEVHFEKALNDNVPNEISVNTDAILLEAVTRIDESQ